MKINGMEQWQKHFPDLQSRAGRARVALYFLSIVTLVTVFFVWVDHVFEAWMPDGEIIFIALGFLIMKLFFSRKKACQQKFGELAYRNAFLRFAIPGLGIMLASIAHLAYISGPVIPRVGWSPILVWGGAVFLVAGAGLWLRAIFTFGVDNLALLYVYYPDEGRMIDSSIYGVLRHPVYAGVLRIAFGLALLHASWYGLLVAALMPLGLTGWVRLVEEKELLERFPDYTAYRRRVPAFWPKFTNLGKFWRYLILGG